jgi:hypothetical protein
MVEPNVLPSLGSCFGPKIIKAIPKIINNSDVPILPNIDILLL